MEIDRAILIDNVAKGSYKELLEGAVATKVADQSGYLWIRSDLKHGVNDVAAGIRAHRATTRTPA